MKTILPVLVGLLVAGCGSSSAFMKPSEAKEIGPPPAGKARIVFIRPSGYAAAAVPTILDRNANFVGDLVARSKFAVDVDPGAHVFILWSESTRALKANVAAGKTYYVEAAVGMGMWTASVTLRAIKPSSEHWRKLDEWMARTQTMTVDTAAGQAHVDKRKADAKDVVRKGLERWEDNDEEEIRTRTLGPDDGR